MNNLKILDVCLIIGLNDDVLLNNMPCFILAVEGNKCAIYISGDICLHQIYVNNLLYLSSLNTNKNKIINIKNNIIIHNNLFIFTIDNNICIDEIKTSILPKSIISKCIMTFTKDKLFRIP